MSKKSRGKKEEDLRPLIRRIENLINKNNDSLTDEFKRGRAKFEVEIEDWNDNFGFKNNDKKWLVEKEKYFEKILEKLGIYHDKCLKLTLFPDFKSAVVAEIDKYSDHLDELFTELEKKLLVCISLCLFSCFKFLQGRR